MEIRQIVYGGVFAGLTAIGALISIPTGPVPITLQTLFVLLSGCLLGWRTGIFSQILYLLGGAAGFPIFAQSGGGLAHILGPTGGYLIGFIFAAATTGLIAGKTSDSKRLILGCISGTLVIYIFGLPWLMISLKLNFSKALMVGLIPFIPGDIAKSIFAGIIAARLKKTGRYEEI